LTRFSIIRHACLFWCPIAPIPNNTTIITTTTAAVTTTATTTNNNNMRFFFLPVFFFSGWYCHPMNILFRNAYAADVFDDCGAWTDASPLHHLEVP
jgi:hypothetical protein